VKSVKNRPKSVPTTVSQISFMFGQKKQIIATNSCLCLYELTHMTGQPGVRDNWLQGSSEGPLRG
jgi:hypothetical protein